MNSDGLRALNVQLKVPTMAEFGIDKEMFWKEVPSMAASALARCVLLLFLTYLYIHIVAPRTTILSFLLSRKWRNYTRISTRRVTTKRNLNYFVITRIIIIIYIPYHRISRHRNIQTSYCIFCTIFVYLI